MTSAAKVAWRQAAVAKTLENVVKSEKWLVASTSVSKTGNRWRGGVAASAAASARKISYQHRSWRHDIGGRPWHRQHLKSNGSHRNGGGMLQRKHHRAGKIKAWHKQKSENGGKRKRQNISCQRHHRLSISRRKLNKRRRSKASFLGGCAVGINGVALGSQHRQGIAAAP